MIPALMAAFALAQAPVPAPANIPVCAPPSNAERLWVNPATRFVVIGELHGTTELPAAIAEIACMASAGRPVTVGVEFEDSTQAALDRWMFSDGGTDARTEFLSNLTWTRRFQDGRSSQAMFAMLERLRQLKASGRDIAVVAFVPGAHAPSGFAQAYYELAMASRLSAMAQARPGALNVVLVGRYHAAKAPQRAVGHLPPADVISVTMRSQGGQAWFCPNKEPAAGQPPESVCRAISFEGEDDLARGVVMMPPEEQGFDGVLALGPTTASPPARTVVTP